MRRLAAATLFHHNAQAKTKAAPSAPVLTFLYPPGALRMLSSGQGRKLVPPSGPRASASTSRTPSTASQLESRPRATGSPSNDGPIPQRGWSHAGRSRMMAQARGEPIDDEVAWARRKRKDEPAPAHPTPSKWVLRPPILSTPSTAHIGIRTDLSIPRLETLQGILEVAQRKARAKLPRPKHKPAPTPLPPSLPDPPVAQHVITSRVAAAMIAAKSRPMANNNLPTVKLTRREKRLWARTMRSIARILRERGEGEALPPVLGRRALEISALERIIQESIARRSPGLEALEKYLRERLLELRKEEEELMKANPKPAVETAPELPIVEAPPEPLTPLVETPRTFTAPTLPPVSPAVQIPSPFTPPTPSTPSTPSTPPTPSDPPTPQTLTARLGLGSFPWHRIFPWMSKPRRFHTLARVLGDAHVGRQSPRIHKFRAHTLKNHPPRRSASTVPLPTSFRGHRTPVSPIFLKPPTTPQAVLRHVVECSKPYRRPTVRRVIDFHNAFGFLRSTASFNHVLSVCIRERHFLDALRCFDEMRRAHIPWDKGTWFHYLRLAVAARRWTVAQEILQTQQWDLNTLLALLPGQALKRPQKAHIPDTEERLELLGRIHINVSPEDAVSLSHRATYKLVRALLLTKPDEALPLTEQIIRGLPPAPDSVQLYAALGLIHLNIQPPERPSGTRSFYSAQNRLRRLLKLHPHLRPTSQTLYLLLQHLRFAQERYEIARYTARDFKKRWGPEVEDYWTLMVQARYAMHKNRDSRAMRLLQEARLSLLAHEKRGVRDDPRTSYAAMRWFQHGRQRFHELMRRWAWRNRLKMRRRKAREHALEDHTGESVVTVTSSEQVVIDTPVFISTEAPPTRMAVRAAIG